MKKYLILLMGIILSNVYIYANTQSILDQIKKLEEQKAVFEKNLADKEQAYENAKKDLEKNNPKGLENLEIAYNGENGAREQVVKEIKGIQAQINTLINQLPPSQRPNQLPSSQTPGTGNPNNIINSNANQNASISAMGSNYQLFLANLNSLNKRMGELRDNPKDQGVWARIFTGLQTSKFALQTNSFYTTIQGGYDHAFGFNGANNYLGFAISYINSSAKNLDTSYKGINTSISNGIELAIYNAYVQDGASSATGWKNGLYTDSIIKFSLMYNSLTLLNQSDEYSIDNFAFSISQEVGYRFILGQTNEWYIDPQAELTFGYFDQSQLHQVIGASYLDGIQDSILTLRGRIGSSFGYKFDKFTEGKNFKAQAYLGTYFVGDYITGGDISLTNLNKTISLTPLSSTARFTLNLGTNIAIKDDHRIYFDFERSFGGSIITQYQFNLGYRYSFGEYTPLENINTAEASNDSKIKEVAPTQGYYIKLLSTKKASKKELRVLKGINNLKTQNIGDSKSYLIGPFKGVNEAKNEKNNYEGVLKELKSEGEVIEVE